MFLFIWPKIFSSVRDKSKKINILFAREKQNTTNKVIFHNNEKCVIWSLWIHCTLAIYLLITAKLHPYTRILYQKVQSPVEYSTHTLRFYNTNPVIVCETKKMCRRACKQMKLSTIADKYGNVMSSITNKKKNQILYTELQRNDNNLETITGGQSVY